MSGPKSASYEVTSNPRRESRWAAAAGWAAERAAAKRRAELIGRANALAENLSKAAGLWQQVRGQHGADFPAWSHGEAPPDIDKMKDNDALEAVVRDLAERVAKAQREYAQQSALFNIRTSLQVAGSRAAVSSAQEEKAQREERELRRCAEEVSRLLETLEAEVSHEDRTAIENRAQETVGSSQASRRRALLAQLRLDIQRANAAGQARQRMVEQAEQWRERLLGLEGTEVEQLDQALRQVAEGQASLPADMAQKVEDVVARATEASDRAYALDVITEELENLGYVVEVGFETAAAQGSEMLLHKSGMEDDYHVSLQAEAGAPHLHAKMVRETSGRSLGRNAKRERTDHQMERIWCQDFAAALAAAERRGVRGRIAKRVEAGQVPVQTIAPLKGKSKRKSKRTNQLKSRGGR